MAGWQLAGCGRAMGGGWGAESGIIKMKKILDILSAAIKKYKERNITGGFKRHESKVKWI